MMETGFTKNFYYTLKFGNIIALNGEQPKDFVLEQGSPKKISDGNNNYEVLLSGIKVNRKIYQPTSQSTMTGMMNQMRMRMR